MQLKSDRRKFMNLAAASPLLQTKAAPLPAKQGEHEPIKPYLAMAVQSKVISATSMSDVHRNVDHVVKIIDQYMKGVWQLSGGGAPKLVVLPESFLHGYGPMQTRTFEN